MRGWIAFAAMGVTLARTGGPTQAQCTDPSVCGPWLNPEELGISCDLGIGNNDEIGHVTLIPVGEHQGRLLVWTRSDDRELRDGVCPYKSFVIERAGSGWAVRASMSFDPALPDFEQADAPFCSGHTWVTDSEGDPKFLAAGGIRYVTGSPSSAEAYWFDPLDTTGQWWFDGPDEMPAPSWYPSVITYLDSTTNRFLPLAVGGSSRLPVTCSDLYEEWWTLSLSSGTWTTHTDANAPSWSWEGYPRTFFIAEATAPHGGEVLSAGHDIACDLGPFPYGGNPCNRIRTSLASQAWVPGPNPNDACGPGDPTDCIWGWNSNHGAMLHTLKSTWDFNAADRVAQYDLNRIFMTGGNKEEPEFGDDDEWNAYAYTLEYTGSSWVKLPEPEPRTFANFTLLPDGTILLVGGQTEFRRGGLSTTTNQYWTTANRFDPDTGTWTGLATMLPYGSETPPMPRGYHSASILMPDGSVALMGGQRDQSGNFNGADSEDSIDVFQPPYFFNGARPGLFQVPETIQYDQPFTVKVLFGTPFPNPGDFVPIERFCLIGIGSVTHHFDYGQRYVELLYQPVTSNKFRLRAPPVPAMAPDGYYLLYGVDAMGRPSAGKFVRLTF